MQENKQTLYQKQAVWHEYKDNLADLFRFAAKQHGKQPMTIIKEFWKLSRGAGKLTIYDYFLYHLYDDTKHNPEAKTRFISERLHWPVTSKCCNMDWKAMTEDKWISYNLLDRFGIKIPKTIAVIDQSLRRFAPEPKVASPAALKDLLRQIDSYPIFAKPNLGIASAGAFVITGIDDTHVFLDQSEPLTYEEIFKDIIGEHTYLLQEFVENHPKIKKFSKYVATVRTVNLVRSDSIRTPFTLMKIPSPTNIADNYWREGNLLADINPENGVVRHAIRGKGVRIEDLTSHPDTGEKLVGMVLPDWEQLRSLNETCARLFAPVRYQSLDIALTSDGPIVVEINTGGSFELPQLAAGTGLLTDEVRDFFESCGWKFRAKSKISRLITNNTWKMP